MLLEKLLKLIRDQVIEESLAGSVKCAPFPYVGDEMMSSFGGR